MTQRLQKSSSAESQSASKLDGKLATYLATAGAVSFAAASPADAAVVATKTNLQFGPANGGPGNIDLPIDLDLDGELDFQLRHKSNTLGEDYLEFDKSPDPNSDFPDLNMDGNNQSWRYLEDTEGSYPHPLPAGVF